jgi:hypothetical protein
MRRLVLSLLLVAVSATPALAGPFGDVKRSMMAFAALHSYHMEWTLEGHAFESDIMRPGRMRIRGPNDEEAIMLPGVTYMKMHGTWTKLANTRSRSLVDDLQAATASIAQGNFSAVDLGTKLVDGLHLHAYRVTPTQKELSPPDSKPDSFTLYIGSNDLPRRMETSTGEGGVIIRFSDFNAPMTITAPYAPR